MPRLWAAVGIIDLLLLTALVYTAGGSQLQLALMLLLLAVLVALTFAFTRRLHQLQGAASSSQRLVDQVLTEVDHARRRIAQEIHDVHLQNLQAAINEVRRERRTEDGLDLVNGILEATVDRLRHEAADLYPASLELVGLDAAISELGDRKAHQGGYSLDIDVDPRASGPWDEHVYAITRELLTNATRHAQATRVAVTVVCADAALVLEVADDGVGIPPGRRDSARRAGHIGLAASEDRVRALGGTFRLTTGAGGTGTLARAVLPTRRARDKESSGRHAAPAPPSIERRRPSPART